VSRGAILALLVLSLGGCKKKSREPALVMEYRDRICACKDIACANQLNDEFAKRASDTRGKEGPPDERVMKQIQECAAKLYAPAASGLAEAEVGSGGTSQPALPTMPAVRQADLLINIARAWQKSPRFALDEIQVSYVDADGVLDGEFGVLMVRYGTASGPVDDPKRKTGARRPSPRPSRRAARRSMVSSTAGGSTTAPAAATRRRTSRAAPSSRSGDAPSSSAHRRTRSRSSRSITRTSRRGSSSSWTARATST
jgi:hypothetical protein